jgi:hypothetical protein
VKGEREKREQDEQIEKREEKTDLRRERHKNKDGYIFDVPLFPSCQPDLFLAHLFSMDNPILFIIVILKHPSSVPVIQETKKSINRSRAPVHLTSFHMTTRAGLLDRPPEMLQSQLRRDCSTDVYNSTLQSGSRSPLQLLSSSPTLPSTSSNSFPSTPLPLPSSASAILIFLCCFASLAIRGADAGSQQAKPAPAPSDDTTAIDTGWLLMSSYLVFCTL